MTAQGTDQAVLLELDRSQLEDQGAHLREGFALEVTQLPEPCPRGIHVAIQQQLDAARDEPDREQRLGDRVVQFAREVRPFRTGSQLGGLASKVAFEA